LRIHAYYVIIHFMKTTQYPAGESTIIGTFFELADEEYIQIENQGDGAVAIWSSTSTLEDTIDAFQQILGEASTTDEASILLVTGQHITPSSAQAEQLAQSNAVSVDEYIAIYGPDDRNVSWRKEHIKLIAGSRPLVEVALAGTEVNVSSLTKLVELTGSSAVREAFLADNTAFVAALGDKATLNETL
jgi:hypothetical protein